MKKRTLPKILFMHTCSESMAIPNLRHAHSVPLEAFPLHTGLTYPRKNWPHSNIKCVIKLIACKGATYFGIASCVARLYQAVLNAKLIAPISSFHTEFGVCISTLTIIGEKE